VVAGWGKGRYAGYLVGATGVIMGGALAICEIALGQGGVAYIVEQAIFAFVILCAAAISGVLALRGSGREARIWLLVSAACTSVFVSQVYWTWVVGVSGAVPEPLSVSNIFDILAVGLFSGLLITLRPVPHARISLWRLAVDIAGLFYVLTALMYVYVITPWYGTIAHTTAWGAILGAAYPVFGIYIFSGTTRWLLGPKIRMWNKWERLMAWAIVCLSAGMILWPIHYAASQTGANLFTVAVDLLWASGMFLVFGAAVYRLDSATEWSITPVTASTTAEVSVSRFASPLMYGVTAMVLGYEAASPAGSSLSSDVLGAMAAAAGIVFVIRTLLVAMEAREMVSLARTDSLTGVGDHSAFSEALDAAISTAERYGAALSLAMLDLDRMQHYRDMHGRAEADDLLRAVAAVARDACVGKGSVFRIGTDRFAMILHGMHGGEAQGVVNAVRAAHVSRNKGVAPTTLSAGVACYPDDARSVDGLMVNTEKALWWAKANGRDRVIVHDATVASAERLGGVLSRRGQRSRECLRTMAASIDSRYDGTRDHSRRVANLALILGHELGIDAKQLGDLELAALLHDLGMVIVPEAVLLHKGPLSERQWQTIREHPVLGDAMVAAADMGRVGRIVRCHHERWDGHGYPDGLREQDVPLEARILAVCEAFDAMTSERPYRGPMSVASALQQVDLGICTQFDPVVAEAFIRLVSRDDVLGPTAEAFDNLFKP